MCFIVPLRCEKYVFIIYFFSINGPQQRYSRLSFARTDAAVVPASVSPAGAEQVAAAEPAEDWEAAHADDDASAAAAPVAEEIKDAWDASSEVCCARRLQA